jgi:hypothetical protein
MIIRVALFLTLVSMFYFYCTDDSDSNQFRGPNDINMIEVPSELSPRIIESSNTAFNTTQDTLTSVASTYSLQD